MIERNFSNFTRALGRVYPDAWFEHTNIIVCGIIDEIVLFNALKRNMSVFLFRQNALLEVAREGICEHEYSLVNRLDRKETVVYVSHYANTPIADQMARAGFTMFVDGYLPHRLTWKDHFDPNLIKDNIEKIILAEKILEGNLSKETYWGRLIYRLTHNPIYSNRTKGKDYFHPMCSPLPGDVIIDGGAFDGVSVKRFNEMLSGKCIIHSFEADSKNYVQLKKLSSKYVHTYNLGLYDSKTTLEFVSTGGVGAHIRDAMGVKDTPNSSIDVIDLDTFCEEQNITPDFIKLDVEGAECAVLRGAAKTLQRKKPRLAISAYHRYDDLWEIPLLIKEINPDYTIYLAHYDRGKPFWDPIYYAV